MDTRLYVATRKGIFIVEPTGSTAAVKWQITSTAFLGDNLPMLLPDPRDGSIYAALEHGHFGSKLHRSQDGGNTWQEIGVPTYPQPQPGEESTDPFRGTVIAWKLDKIWALTAGLANQPGVLWCGTIPGGLFVSYDFGATWTLNRPLWDHPKRKVWAGGGADKPGIHSICVHPDDNKVITVGVSCGGVWATRDGGESWSQQAMGMRAAYMPPEQAMDPDVQDPHCVVQCPGSPSHFWAQHHNGIFRSTDGVQSWHEIECSNPSSFGFAVAVHPRDPNTAWFVPGIKDERRIPVDGRLVVTRTRDGGKSFDQLHRGLPQEHAYDLVYRHAMDIDGTGNRLAFGSTTGSLWVTEDQGDSWQNVSTHLPPIYCVRFGL